MSIREIARQLYKLEKETERIEKMLETAEAKEKEKLKLQLKKIKTERDRVRGILEGMKQSSVQRKVR